MQLDPERVSVQSTALVALGNVRKEVCCLESELLEDLGGCDSGGHLIGLGLAPGVLDDINGHQRSPVSLWVCRLSFHWGCSRQYSIAICVFRSRSGPSIGCR